MSEPIIRLLLIEDEEFDVRRVMNTIKPFKDRIQVLDVVANGHVALDLLSAQRDRYDVVVMDFQIAGGLMGVVLIREIKKIDPSLQIIVITKMTMNVADYDFASGLLRAGAFWYCTKYPGDIEEYIYQPTDFILSILNAYQKKLLEKEHSTSKQKLIRNVEEILAQKQIIGVSPAVEMLRDQVAKCSESEANVLISGSSGTGKELIAYNIHYGSRRKLENFVPINCGGLPNELIESELFGYEKGAFTGANAKKLGLFEIADHGTLFLDEVGELPPPAQVKLLRVIQDGEIEKIGRTGKMKVNVRIIAATNKDLPKEVGAKRFREDLFYRLNVIPVTIPPLRDRSEDIPILFDHFLKLFSADMGRMKPEISDDAVRALIRHAWPGNIRELKNVVTRLLFTEEKVLTEALVQSACGIVVEGEHGEESFNLGLSSEILPWREMEHLIREKYFLYVREHSLSDTEAARKLGLAPPNYHRMCKELGLKS